jgi:two-component system response regulator PilR (NtrC family)
MNTAAQPVAPAADRRPPRILVVDDERSMRELLAIVLRREGYEVLLAENGRSAVDVSNGAVDLLISDIRCGSGGVDVLRGEEDRSGHPQHHDPAFASTETAVEAVPAPATI